MNKKVSFQSKQKQNVYHKQQKLGNKTQKF